MRQRPGSSEDARPELVLVRELEHGFTQLNVASRYGSQHGSADRDNRLADQFCKALALKPATVRLPPGGGLGIDLAVAALPETDLRRACVGTLHPGGV